MLVLMVIANADHSLEWIIDLIAPLTNESFFIDGSRQKSVGWQEKELTTMGPSSIFSYL